MNRKGVFVAAVVLALFLTATQWSITKIPAVVGIVAWIIVVSTLVSVDQCVLFLGPWVRHMDVDLRKARWLISRGAVLLVLVPAWFSVCASIYAVDPQMFEVFGDTKLIIAGLPIILLLIVGYCMIFCGILLRNIARRS